jgi:hypothetical protein
MVTLEAGNGSQEEATVPNSSRLLLRDQPPRGPSQVVSKTDSQPDDWEQRGRSKELRDNNVVEAPRG